MIKTNNGVTSATFNQIVVRNDNRSEWARLLWEERTGRVFLVTAWGSWSHCWTHIGKQSLASFLSQLDIGYAGRKFLSGSLYEFSRESTIQAIRETILQSRRCGGMTREQAADEWRHVARFEDGFYMDFREWVEASSMNDAYECSRKEMVGSWDGFWNRLWVPKIKPVLFEFSSQA